MNSVLQRMIIASLSGALEVISKLMDDANFKRIMDDILNSVEGFFKEDSTLDVIAETITAKVRERFDIEDSNPDN